MQSGNQPNPLAAEEKLLPIAVPDRLYAENYKKQEKMAKPRIIAVLGMHRSGTSSITRSLSVLGVELGNNLMPPIDGNNAKGFWEDMDLYRFNERLLGKAGNAWDRLSLLEADRLTRDEFAAERYEASALIERKLADTNIFGFKDPRTALLLPFWRCIFDDLGIDDNYVIALRNPLEVAESLRKRDKFDPTHGMALWLKYMWASVQYSTDRKRVCVSYKNLVADPETELNRIASALELVKPSRSNAAYIEYVAEFLTPALRHNRISDNELARSSAIPQVIQKFYAQLSDWAEAPPEQTFNLAAKTKGQVEGFWSANEALLHLGDRLRDSAISANAKLSQTENAHTELENQIILIRAEKVQLQERLSTRDVELEASLKNLSTQAQRIADLGASKIEADQALRDAKAELEDNRQNLSTQSLRIADLAANKIEADQALRDVQTELETALKKVADSCTRSATLESTIAELSSNKSAIAAQLLGVRQDLASEQSARAALSDELAERTKALRLLRHEFNSFEEVTKSKEALANTNLTYLEAQISNLQQTVQKSAEQIALLRDRENSLAFDLAQALQERAAIEARSAALLAAETKLNTQLSELRSKLANTEASMSRAEAALVAREETSQTAHRLVIELKNDLAEKTKTNRLLRHEVLALRSSTSWRATKPLRMARTVLTQPKLVFIRLFKTSAPAKLTGRE